MKDDETRVGYQGGEGAYSHIAAKRHFASLGAACTLVGFRSFSTMFDALRAGDVGYAVLPIENSIAGSINESYDLLAANDFVLVGEEIQPVEHCLIATEEGPVERIGRIYSHPVALAQCRSFLEGLQGCHVEAYWDTAQAVAKIKEDKDSAQAAIASESAARLYGLPVLQRAISDHPENYTRMVIVATEGQAAAAGPASKTSLIFSTAHEKGALSRCIGAFSEEGFNLSKLESRPKPGSPFEYLFYLDVEGSTADPKMQAALDKVRNVTSFLKILGSYTI